MSYIFAFFLIFCFSVGIITYIFAFALFFRKRTRVEVFFLLFLTFFTLRVINDTAHFYFSSLFSGEHIFYFFILLLGRVVTIFLDLFLILFVHALVQKGQSRRVYVGIVSIFLAFLVFILIQTIGSFVSPFPAEEDIRGFHLLDSLFFIVLLYPVTIFFLHWRSIQNRVLERVAKTLFISFIPFLALMMLFDMGIPRGLTIFIEEVLHIPSAIYVPYYLFYLLMNGLLLFYGFRHYIDRKHGVSGERRLDENFLRDFGITAREREIITLLIEGYSNRRIGEALYISPATVRTHLHNIFEKCGAENRYELIRRAST